ncbi:paralemmin-1-like [Lethenteron reissneri]|uniref:paralemmin-1-like n=1 Tax=Lethenteron reissneri TaxID=7753 RepID=UPI002AB5FFE8|nr:paralemmin-1-like [Lethenteron reissneri]
MEMDVVAQLQKERLQTLTERRSRQEDIENKKRALEDEKLNLQHFKTKVLRERWLLEGAPAGSAEEQEAVKNQLAENEQRSKQLEETIHRYGAARRDTVNLLPPQAPNLCSVNLPNAPIEKVRKGTHPHRIAMLPVCRSHFGCWFIWGASPHNGKVVSSLAWERTTTATLPL